MMRRFAGRLILRCLVPCLVLLGGDLSVGSARAAVSEQQIEASITKAVGFLRLTLASANEGRLSLAVLALLKAGVDPGTPELKGAIEKIAKRVTTEGKFEAGSDHIYDAGVTLMALANADPQKYKRHIEAIAQYIISYQGNDGEWDYLPPYKSQGDTSISQYAILGLWEASRSGVKIPRGVWDKAARWHISRQQRDGGFTYHPAGGGGGPYFGPVSHTMTVAGSASLLVARLHLFGDAAKELLEDPATGRKRGKKYGLLIPATGETDEPEIDLPQQPIRIAGGDGPIVVRLNAIDKAVTEGRKWLTEHFTVTPDSGWRTYFLYGLERFGSLANVREFNGHDWYEEGCSHLVSAQQPNGAWDDTAGPIPATSFCVMFMVRATEKMLNRPRRTPTQKFGGGLLVGGRGLPENLTDAQLDKGLVKPRKLKSPVDVLLAQLEDVKSENVEAAQSSLVEQIATENPEALIGQTDRLLRLARDKRIEVRRTAFWALGRSNDLRVAPVLIQGLLDPDPACMIEAHNALRFISKRVTAADLPDDATEPLRAQTVAMWRRWYQTVRPYDERDDLAESAKP